MNNYQWYPGHMTKAVRMMKEHISIVDMVIELLDARIPVSSRNPDIGTLSQGKSRLVILNKSDLADNVVTKLWAEHFRSAGAHVIMLDSKKGSNRKQVLKAIEEAGRERRKRDSARGINRPVRAMICGIPNVGKSTFINGMAGRASTKTGNKPGVTKGKQWITLADGAQLLDTPGILWPKFEDEEVGLHLAFIGSMNDNNLDSTELAIDLIRFLQLRYPGALAVKYGFDTEELERLIEEEGLFNEEGAILAAVAKKRNCLLKGARPDYERAANMLLDDFRNGKTGRFSIERPEDVMS